MGKRKDVARQQERKVGVSKEDAPPQNAPPNSVEPLPDNLRRRLNRAQGRPRSGKIPIIPTMIAALLLLFIFTFAMKLLPGNFKPSVHPDLARHPSPLPTDELDELNAHSYRDQTLWGSYRPGYYLGLRMRTPRSLLFGLLWWDHRKGPQGSLQSLRHEARHEDGLRRFGWVEHDGRSYGRQHLEDGTLNLTLHYAKRWPGDSGPGGDWAVRVTAERIETGEIPSEVPEDAPRPRVASFLLYVGEELAAEGLEELAPKRSAIKVHTTPGSLPKDQPSLAAFGSQATTGLWELHLVPSTPGCILSTAKANFRQPSFHNLTATVKGMLADHFTERQMAGEEPRALKMPDYVSEEEGNNVGLIQVTVKMPCTFDVVFLSGLEDSSPKIWKEGLRWRSRFQAPEGEQSLDEEVRHLAETFSWTESDVHSHIEGQAPRVDALSGPALTALLDRRSEAFQRRLEDKFGPFTAPSESVSSATVRAMISGAVSNLVGGLGYFFGRTIVEVKTQGETRYGLTFTAPLLTAVPSRSFFPRGFLWDEGFHQLVLGKWDPTLSRDCLAHWLGLMTSSGWIPREQILGDEARMRVPAEFIAQKPSHANPPALALALATEVRRAQDGDERAIKFLELARPRVTAWIKWFNHSQAGEVPGAYYWHGREGAGPRELNPKSLSSGLDDFPRASHPDAKERHLDLRCWMALALDVLRDMDGTVAGSTAPTSSPSLRVARAEAHLLDAALRSLTSFQGLQELHLDETSGMFLDWGYHTEDLTLARRPTPDGRGTEVVRRPTKDGEAPSYRFVPHYGYVSLFPLIAGLLPVESPELGRQLELLRRSDLIWSPHGLRSLSASSSLYQKHNTEHDPPYWRGAIWVNINYLTLRALKAYGEQAGPHAARAQELYAELRGNVLTTIARSYEGTGYLWEQYSDSGGKGKGTHPFTGWTALVTLIAGEHYPPALKILASP